MNFCLHLLILALFSLFVLSSKGLYVEYTPKNDLRQFTECLKRIAIRSSIICIKARRNSRFSAYYECIKVLVRSEATKYVNNVVAKDLYCDYYRKLVEHFKIEHSSEDFETIEAMCDDGYVYREDAPEND